MSADKAPGTSDKNDKPKRDVGDALGMVETRGLVGMIEAADAMCKTANVVFVGWQKVDAGLVTAIVRGDVGSVRFIVDGNATANSVPEPSTMALLGIGLLGVALLRKRNRH